MHALLGKITAITELPEADDLRHLSVRVRPVCILPERHMPPAWLADQVVTVARAVVDPREVGGPGDSIVLTPAESARYLRPLTVEPPVVYGAVPERLRATLRWWKDEHLPECVACANGREARVPFLRDEGGHCIAEIPVADLYPAPPAALPATITVTCGPLRSACSVLPPGASFARKLLLPTGEVYRVENAWYAVDLITDARGGAIVGLCEKGRGLDHFAAPAEIIAAPGELAGYTDRCRTGGWHPGDKLAEVALESAGASREGGATRVWMDGVVDEGAGLRTAVTCTLFDEAPLLAWRREFARHPAKDDGKAPAKPKEPIDAVQTMGMGFRAAWVPDQAGLEASRILTAYEGQLIANRCAQANEHQPRLRWQLRAGWALVEHPLRQAYMLLLVDAVHPPTFGIWRGRYTMTLEPTWEPRPLLPGVAIGVTVAMAGGELAGAAPEGAWVACRAPLEGGGVRCGIVARLTSPEADTASFQLGDEGQEVRLHHVLVPGVGEVAYAVAEFTDRTLAESFDVVVAGIRSRRTA